MTAAEIRAWGTRNFGKIVGLANNTKPSEGAIVSLRQAVEAQVGQMLMLAEIAAQLAEANALTRFELGIDEEEPS